MARKGYFFFFELESVLVEVDCALVELGVFLVFGLGSVAGFLVDVSPPALGRLPSPLRKNVKMLEDIDQNGRLATIAK